MHHQALPPLLRPYTAGVPVPHTEVLLYPTRILITGTRGYSDYAFFEETVFDYMVTFEAPILFITGAARSGADDMIIYFCKKHHQPWAEYPAEWDRLDVPGAVIRHRRHDGKAYNVKAGFNRNKDMGDVATNCMAWWDGQSKGTLDMIEYVRKLGIEPDIYLVDIVKRQYG